METSPQVYAKIAGVLLVISILAGGFGEMFVVSKLVTDNATTTVQNILSHESLYRLGFASYLIEAICDVSLVLVLYLLVRPVNKTMASLTILFGLVSVITFAFAELFYIAALLILDGDFLTSFSADQVNSLAMFSIKLYGYAAGVFMLFYGLATLLRGYLIFQSGYLPKFLGILLIFGGTCFVMRNFLLVLAPGYASNYLLLPTAIAILTLSLWLLTKG
ncbi:MAG: DUF4386 domain-containing protein, partial [Bacteroidota bacterium]